MTVTEMWSYVVGQFRMIKSANMITDGTAKMSPIQKLLLLLEDRVMQWATGVDDIAKDNELNERKLASAYGMLTVINTIYNATYNRKVQLTEHFKDSDTGTILQEILDDMYNTLQEFYNTKDDRNED